MAEGGARSVGLDQTAVERIPSMADREYTVGTALRDFLGALLLSAAAPRADQRRRTSTRAAVHAKLCAGITRFSKRDAWQATRGYFKKAAELEVPLRLLCEHGYLHEEHQERSGPGRRPGALFMVNSYSRSSHNSQKQNTDSQREEPDEPLA
jgi:hypothetical protein